MHLCKLLWNQSRTTNWCYLGTNPESPTGATVHRLNPEPPTGVTVYRLKWMADAPDVHLACNEVYPSTAAPLKFGKNRQITSREFPTI